MKVIEEPRHADTDPPDAEGTSTEALIREARRRQRLRWLSIAAAVLILAAVSALLVTHFTSATKKTASPTVTKGTTTIPTCLASQILAANGTPLGGASEEGSFTITLTNRGHRPCVLDGYPHVDLVTSGGTVLNLPRVANTGFVTTARPRRVLLGVGATGYVLVAKFACVLGDLQAISEARLALPGAGEGTAFTIPITRSIGTLALCNGGATPPEDGIAVSPVEPRLGATLPGPQRT